MLQIFTDASDGARWIVPIHHVVIHNLVATATQADQALRQAGSATPGKLSAVCTYLQSSIFSDTVRKGDTSGFTNIRLVICLLAAIHMQRFIFVDVVRKADTLSFINMCLLFWLWLPCLCRALFC